VRLSQRDGKEYGQLNSCTAPAELQVNAHGDAKYMDVRKSHNPPAAPHHTTTNVGTPETIEPASAKIDMWGGGEGTG